MDQAQLQQIMAQYLQAMQGQQGNPQQLAQQQGMQQLMQQPQMQMGGFTQPQMPNGNTGMIAPQQGIIGGR